MQINTFNVIQEVRGGLTIDSFAGTPDGYILAKRKFKELVGAVCSRNIGDITKDGYFRTFDGRLSIYIKESVTAPKNMIKVTHTIYEFVKDVNDNKVGCFVGLGNETEYRIGWSLCNIKAGDVFDRGTAYNQAVKRAVDVNNDYPVPHSLKEFNTYFNERCKRYFKPAKLDFGNPPAGQEWHNPAGLTPEQVDIKHGWRLLLKSEIAELGGDFRREADCWVLGTQGKFYWKSGNIGMQASKSYRTRQSLPKGK